MTDERAFTFNCSGDKLLGIVHAVPRPARRGVLVVVGGPQYRIGSHRQFLLLARALAAAGIPTMRFDYRGMGDSDGTYRGFEHVDADIAAALDAFQARCPGLEEIVLWGLCDAASAILFYAYKDARVRGIVLMNPWVRTIAGEAKAYIRHYYTARLVDPAFWRKVASGRFDVGASLRSLGTFIRNAVAARDGKGTQTSSPDLDSSMPLPARMAEGLRHFRGPVLLLISGNDLTAREFLDAAAASSLWRDLLAEPRITRRDLPTADHTFSQAAWREQVIGWTVDAVQAGTRA